MEEIVDIVDENLNVLYSVPKSEAHAKGLLHKCVIAEIIDSKGNWILVKQASHKQDKEQLVSPVGGHVSAGERDEKALKREVFEEVGLTVSEYKYIGKAILNREVNGKKENHYFILYTINSDEDFILNDEAVEYKKFSISELREELKNNPSYFGDAFLFIVNTFYKNLLLSS